MMLPVLKSTGKHQLVFAAVVDSRIKLRLRRALVRNGGYCVPFCSESLVGEEASEVQPPAEILRPIVHGAA